VKLVNLLNIIEHHFHLVEPRVMRLLLILLFGVLHGWSVSSIEDFS